MLKIENLSFVYGRAKRPVINDLSLELPEGVVCGLLAPNGTGKTTLLQLIMGALTPRAGSVVFDGTDTRLRRPDVLAQMMLVPEQISLPSLSLKNFTKLYGALYPSFSQEIMDRCISEFHLEVPGRVNALSMGQMKKVYLAFALACQPRLLLMDEPTNGLDIPGKAAMRRLLASVLPENTTVVISTHQVRDLEQMLERIIIMDNKRLLLDSTVSDIQRAMAFYSGASREDAAQALASVPSPAGFDIIVPNLDPDNTETPVNLEMLFEFAMTSPDSLMNLISNAKTPVSHEQL